ncbi:hypothetical protein Goari_022506 [Gossypium aridum]|uniref:Reverse transcriptase zinc-binding domain-containing protein n=1 Tax=Gossypium aridum TaxID=34290 RepID=A0A7J8YRX8_GOSAI|nr:hypothetical protein [Gossypium aridum]
MIRSSLNVASKIKTTLWKMAIGYLPTLSNLQVRRIAAVSCCPICRADEESIKHVFQECLFTRQILQDLKVASSPFNGERDALTIINKLKSPEEDKSTISVLIKEIKERVRWFALIDFRYVPRKANEAAHILVEEGRRHASPRFWIEEAPIEVEAKVA